MPKDDLYVKIGPTTYFKAPACYSWEILKGKSTNCSLCPVKSYCLSNSQTIKRKDIPWVIADSYTLTTTSDPNNPIEKPLYGRDIIPPLALPPIPPGLQLYGYIQEPYLNDNVTLGDCVISERKEEKL
jgi:hypothetical protein